MVLIGEALIQGRTILPHEKKRNTLQDGYRKIQVCVSHACIIPNTYMCEQQNEMRERDRRQRQAKKRVYVKK